MLPEPDLFRNTNDRNCSSHDPLCSQNTEIESLESDVGGLVDTGSCHATSSCHATLNRQRYHGQSTTSLGGRLSSTPSGTLGRMSTPSLGGVGGRLQTVSRGATSSTNGGGSTRSIPIYSRIFKPSRLSQQDERGTRRWYLVVIVLLYIGLLTSFSLNVSLLLRRETRASQSQSDSASLELPDNLDEFEDELPAPVRNIADGGGGVLAMDGETVLQAVNPGGLAGSEFAYTTPCLVKDPCSAGSFFSCDQQKCLPCPRDTFQSHWGQTSCLPCPNRTHTEMIGAVSAAQCKKFECGKFSRPDLAILQTPNYPSPFPLASTCHWRVKSADSKTSLIIIPSISLPLDCSYSLSVRSSVNKGAGVIFTTCQSILKPQLLTSDSQTLYIDFFGAGNKTSNGFQVSILSIHADISQVLSALLLNADNDRTRQILGYNHKEERLVSRLLTLLSPGLRRPQDKTVTGRGGGGGGRHQQDKPLIEVVQDDSSSSAEHSQDKSKVFRIKDFTRIGDTSETGDNSFQVMEMTSGQQEPGGFNQNHGGFNQNPGGFNQNPGSFQQDSGGHQQDKKGQDRVEGEGKDIAYRLNSNSFVGES